MIIGIGVDMCGISRLEKLVDNNRFVERIFTSDEKTYAESRGVFMATSFAAMFAAKEAFMKAIGTGIGPVPIKDIQIMHNELGKPYFVLHGKAEGMLKQLGGESTHLSISHEGDIAIAFVVLEGNREL